MRLQLITLFAFLVSSSTSHPQPLAHTPLGTLGGLYLPELKQNVFLGIPYALPPVGQLRFARPHPYNISWSGIKNVTSYGPSCMGLSSFSDILSSLDEDCLSLNVVVPAEPCAGENEPASNIPEWIPKGLANGVGSFLDRMGVGLPQEIFQPRKTCSDPLPVFVWIHGGGIMPTQEVPAHMSSFYISRIHGWRRRRPPIQPLLPCRQVRPDGEANDWGLSQLSIVG